MLADPRVVIARADQRQIAVTQFRGEVAQRILGALIPRTTHIVEAHAAADREGVVWTRRHREPDEDDAKGAPRLGSSVLFHSIAPVELIQRACQPTKYRGLDVAGG